MPPNALNKTDFPSITGIAPSGPILPNPSNRVPSQTIATLFHFDVKSYTNFLLYLFSWRPMQHQEYKLDLNILLLPSDQPSIDTLL